MLRRNSLQAILLVFQLCLLPVGAEAAGRVFVDSAGRSVQLPEHVGRVLAAGPPASVLLYTLAPDKMVGWVREPSAAEKEYLAEPYRDLPAHGRLTGKGNTANIEMVMAQKPDLIIDVGTIDATYASLADKVQEQTGIPYVLIDGTFAHTPQTLRTVGDLLGVTDRGEELARYAENVMNDLNTKLAAIPQDKRPRVYYGRGPKGLETGLAGSIKNVSDIGMIFFNNKDAMLDKNVRQAAVMAVDKELLVKRLLRGYGQPIATLETPEYAAFDPSIKVEHNPEKAKELLAASGYSTKKPAKFTIQTTKGFKPKDYEMVQAIVGMWRKVGIEAEIEVYEIAKHYELRAAHKLAPAAFYNWGNAIGDPTTSTGFAMFGPSPHSVWNTDDLDNMIIPLWGEKDEDKRIAGWKAVSKYIAEQGYVIPLLQYAQPILYKSTLKVTPNVSGALQPTLVSPG